MKSPYAYAPEWYTKVRLHPTELYMTPFQICGNLFFVGNEDVSAHLVDTGEGLILFDTGYSHMGGQLVHAIWKLGFCPEDIKMIFHTHGHFDHFGATRFLVQQSGAKTFLGKKDAQMFRQRPELALCHYIQGIPTEFFAPDVELEDGNCFRLGNTVVEAYETPGHSEGAITYRILVTQEDRTYWALLCGGTGFNSLCREFQEEYHNESWRVDFENSLKKWKAMTCDIYLGNHTNQSRTKERYEQMMRFGGNPFLDASQWPKFLEDLERKYQKMLQDEQTP